MPDALTSARLSSGLLEVVAKRYAARCERFLLPPRMSHEALERYSTPRRLELARPRRVVEPQL